MKDISIAQVEMLLKAMQQNNQALAAELLDEIIQERDGHLLQQVEEISKNLHDTLEEFGEDALLLQQTKEDLPDATERLEYVIRTTEEASNKTLASAEQVMMVLESLEDKNLDATVLTALSEIQSEVSKIMMAQSFQDLTGQVLNRIIFLVSSLEQSLHELIAKAGIDLTKIAVKELSEADRKESEMKGIGPNVTQKSQVNNVSSQEDVDDLLGGLGI